MQSVELGLLMWDKRPFSGVEKRKFKRVKKFFVVSAKLSDDDPSDWTIVNLDNISEGGILFNHTEAFKNGELLNIKIKILPDKRPFQCLGKVILGQKLGDLRLYESAVQFTEVNSEDRALIHEALESS